MPDGLKEIGGNIFRDLTSLKKIKLPVSVEKIDVCAFKECSALEEVVFADGSQLKEIGEWAFKGTSLKEIKLPASAEKIAKNAFEGCKNLKNKNI